jgi:5-methyltetrahydrofolate--homocysteine methyltransferase
LVNAIADMREADALRIADEMIEGGTDPLDILEAGRQAMDIVGQRFEACEYFVPELMLAGEILNAISEKVEPHVREAVEAEPIGKVVIGTVEGDIHDIGKGVVTFMLEVNGFEVIDLGVDVSPSRFVDAIKEFEPQVMGMSGLLTLAYEPMKATVEALEEAGLRDAVRVMVGGAPVTEQIRDYTGADAWGKDAQAAVSLAKAWVGGA